MISLLGSLVDLPVQDTEQERLISSLQELDLRGRSALEVYRSLTPASQRDGDQTRRKASKPGKKAKGARGDDKAGANKGGSNPVKTLQGIAKKLSLASLSARCGDTFVQSDLQVHLENKTTIYHCLCVLSTVVSNTIMPFFNGTLQTGWSQV